MMNWHEHFTYDSDAGLLIWKPRPLTSFTCTRLQNCWNARRANKRAGRIDVQGYATVLVLGKHRKAHRIIWEMHHGPIPEGMVIDHIDGNPANNQLTNLRLATQCQNLSNQNRRKNPTGLKGVFRRKNRFHASISVENKRIYLGSFPTKGLAGLAYAKASLKYHGVFSNPVLGKQQCGVVNTVSQYHQTPWTH